LESEAKAMKNKTHQMNGWIDAALFAGFVLACFLDLTGREVHQWLGLALGGLALYHLWRHQAWVLAAGRRWLSGLASRARLFALLDLGLAAGLGAIIFTGVIISSWLNLALSNYADWRGWHVGVTLATLGVLVVKLGLHWRWIAQGLRPRTPAPAPALIRETGRVTETVPVRAAAPAGALSRRDFLQVIGLVSVAALVAGARIVSSQADAAAGAAAATTASSANQTTAATAATAATTSTSSSCQVRCNRRCAYPGHCGRYTDTNQNGRCDLGECS
jgi:hypothetical protein